MRLKDKYVKSCLKWRYVAIAIFALVISVQFVSGLVYAMSKQVSIVDGVDCISFTTYANKTAEVLAKKGIVLSDSDEITPSLDEQIKDGDIINISRAKNITLIDGNNTFNKLTAKKDVQSVLRQFEVQIGSGTILNVELSDEITENMVIKLTHTAEETVTEETEIPFKTTKKATTKLKEGKTQIAQEGSEGILQKVYKVCYENGEQISKELISKTDKVKPVDEIIEYGVKETQAVASIVYHSGTKVSRGQELRYKAVVNVSASAYDLSYNSTGKRPGDRGYGVTATGMRAQQGVVAVDPRVIPLGSRLYIEAADGSWTYGNAVAADTGGSIKGNKIDLFMNSSGEAKRFGRRSATVYILE